MGSVEGFRSDIAGGIDQIGYRLVEFLPCEVLAVFGQIGTLGFIVALRARGVCTRKETAREKKRNITGPRVHEDGGRLSSYESSSVL
jgi:ribosomal protein S28E/S33